MAQINRGKAFLFIVPVLMTAVVTGTARPSFASPVGTTFGWTSTNFQGDGADPAVPFGVATSIAGSGVTVDSSVSVSPAIPALLLTGGLDYIEFSISTDDSGFLAGSSPDPSAWFITGLNWGLGEPPAFATGLIFLSFDVDGAYVPLDGSALGVPVVPNPGTLAGVTGAPAIPIDIAGEPADLIPFDTLELVGTDMLTILLILGLDLPTALSVDSMHVGFEVIHIPEPCTHMLLGCGIAIIGVVRRRKRA